MHQDFLNLLHAQNSAGTNNFSIQSQRRCHHDAHIHNFFDLRNMPDLSMNHVFLYGDFQIGEVFYALSAAAPQNLYLHFSSLLSIK